MVLQKKCYDLKGRVQWFSMQVVMNKCFLLNPEKIDLLNPEKKRLVVIEKNAKKRTL